MLSVRDDTSVGAFGLYVHWPFCKSKCPYCDFNSHVRETIDQEAWRRAFLRELDFYAQLTSHLPLHSIFFGGGTPSLMLPETVSAIIDAAQGRWHFANDIEITLEANPTSTERDKFADFKRAGVNRVSIGIQSLRDEDLKQLGREHTAAEAVTAIDTARDSFDRYSFDLIYTRENQSLSAWEAELNAALKYAGDHLSLYQLTIEPGTAFHTRFQRGDLVLPDDDMSAAFYTLTQDIMEAAGLPAYETSNHARPGGESRHNMIYWHYGEYAGIGPGAHGRIKTGGTRQATRAHRAPESWLARVQGKGHGAHPFEPLTPEQEAEEALLMGLRLTRGIDRDEFLKRTGMPLGDMIDQNAVARLVQSGHLENNTTRLMATRRGMLCLNAVLSHIIL